MKARRVAQASASKSRLLAMRALSLIALTLLYASDLYGQAAWPKPDREKVESVVCRGSGKPLSSSVGTYTVRLVPGRDADDDEICRAYLVGRDGSQTFLLSDSAVSIRQGTGEDVFGDGRPSLILEGYSGGAHCCYRYEIVSLGETPVFLPVLENDAPFFFFRDSTSGEYRVLTADGAFDYFDGLCHACSPFPSVVLQVSARGVRDVSAQFVEQYDTEIAESRKKIDKEDLGRFLVAHDLGTNRQAQFDFMDTRRSVLQIVLSYLYSGREAIAWQTLEMMWPAGDRQRIKKLILSSKSQGILSELGKSKPLSTPVP
jgi:hypothetical protein